MPEMVETTKVIFPKTLVLYRRIRSSVWQCRFKVDGKWQRATTKHEDFDDAVQAAQRLLIEAEIRKKQNLPVVTRRFRDVAKLAVARMEDALKLNAGKVSFADYIRVISEYLIPFLGNRAVTNIDRTALAELDEWRNEKMGRVPSQSTMLTHNAALNRVFDEAEIRGFMVRANRPVLKADGETSERRAAFSMEEVRAMIAAFDPWIADGRSEESRERRLLMRDYALVLLDSGARPGKELIDLRWNQITEQIDPTHTPTNQFDEEGEEIVGFDMRRSVTMAVAAKGKSRTLVGATQTADALRAIGKRNYPKVEMNAARPLRKLIAASNDDFVFRLKDKSDPSASFQKMFESFLTGCNLLVDPITKQKRVFYSLRHTYATFALTHDSIPIHTLAVQMGTSVLMIERHYSHLQPIKAMKQLRREETRKLIDSQEAIDREYLYRKKRSG
jgi:integrase